MNENENQLLLLGRIDGKLDAVLQRQDAQERRSEEHSKRIADLEHAQSRQKGFLAAIAALSGAGGAKLLAFFDIL